MYAHYWHEAPHAERAPFNDFKLLAQLHGYPERVIRDAAVETFRRHLWYFSVHLVLLALFDERVSEKPKAAMVKNLTNTPKPLSMKRLDKKSFNRHTPLEAHVTRRSLKLFDLLSSKGQEETKSFPSKPPACWPMEPTSSQ